jgi:hypothetical protein
MENKNSGKIDVDEVLTRHMNLNETRLGSKKKSGSLETKNQHTPNILYPDTGILGRVIHLMGFNSQGANKLTGLGSRQAYDVAQISKETAIGIAMCDRLRVR